MKIKDILGIGLITGALISDFITWIVVIIYDYFYIGESLKLLLYMEATISFLALVYWFWLAFL